MARQHGGARGRSRARPRQAAAPERADVYLGAPAVADLLAAELAALGKKGGVEVAAGAVAVAAGALVDPCFARTVLPSATLVSAPNANALAAAALDAAALDAGALDAGALDAGALDAGALGAGALDAGALDAATRDPAAPVRGGEGARPLPEDAVVVLPDVARRGSRALEEHPLTAARIELQDVVDKKLLGRRDKHGAPTAPGRALDVLLVDAWRAWVSVHTRAPGPALLAWPARFPAGRALAEDPRDAPSSAHRKLDEALAWLEIAPGEDDVVLDLGAAPGGWTWTCLQRGARVVAVDRADLDPQIEAHPRVTHVRADAFRYTPERRPTWLVCDVIAEPQKNLALAQAALSSSALRALVVTLKLKRPLGLDVLAQARAVARRTPGFFGRVKCLSANKLEVTLMMKRGA